MTPTPLLLDTDIGSDIDDALALAYLLLEPACDLLAITTVTGDVAARGALAGLICRAAGRAVPIHAGDPHPSQPDVPQATVLRDFTPEVSGGVSSLGAVAAMAEHIRARPGEITLLAIGPLTNVARLFAEMPDTVPALARLVTMGGRFFGAGREWNCSCDPDAAAAVFDAPVPEHRMIGLDVTERCALPVEQVRAATTLEPVRAMIDVWTRPDITFHDPIAAATIFDEQICSFESGTARVERDGATSFTASPTGRHRVARSLAADRFFDRWRA